ncbi:MAG: DUF937 domain-containing protein [Xanthobacteraceae bacterium]|nr:MAG: DUF937 domain-containing protein [Xanthobacteraceae bacterium]
MATLEETIQKAIPGGVTKPLLLALLALWASGSLTKQSTTPGGSATPVGTGGSLIDGLSGLVKKLETGGIGDIVSSWINAGPNSQIAPGQLGTALGPEILKTLSEKSGLPQDELTTALAKVLPGLVDNLTPQGRLPTHP